MSIKELDTTYIAHTYKRFPLEIVSGKGSLVYDEAGKEYIDLGSGIAVTSFGVADDVWQQAVIEQMQALPQYDYEVLLIDNCSTDHTRELIRKICSGNPNVKAILNAKNFGQFNSPYYGLCQTTGDCAISICADFQDPVEMIPEMLRYWEEGYQIVCGVKTSSQESKIMYRLRGLYYKAIKRYSEVEQIEQFTGFGLYDRRFLEVMRSLDDSKPFLRGIVAELGGKRKEIPYDQPLRRAGKTHNNLRTLFDAFMLSVTSYTKQVWRMVEVASVALGGGAIVYGAYQLIRKKLFWDEYNAGIAPIIAIIMILSGLDTIHPMKVTGLLLN